MQNVLRRHLLGILLLAFLSPVAWTQDQPGTSLTISENSTFTLRNRHASFTLRIEDGTVRLLNQTGVEKANSLNFEKAYFFKEDSAMRFAHHRIEEERVEGDRVTHAHLRVNVTLDSGNVFKKLVFRLYPDSPVLACDAYYRGVAEDDITDGTSLFSMTTEARHWKYKAVEFFDRTDQNNNLLNEREIIGYEVSQFLNGNLLFANNLINNEAFLILKEAPSSFSQINHKGHDFDLTKYGLDVVGIGFDQSDLRDGHWTKAYSVAISGCGPTELEQISVLRSYQKSIRPYHPDWDEMIMMNTWGDRNRDANIGEDFVKGEIDASRKLGITHLQIDDGWQQGLSKNSASTSGRKWDQWDLKDWEPHSGRFPHGFQPIVEYAKEQGVALGLWFAPSNANSFADWEKDATVIINLNRKYGIRYFKIDGIRLPDKLAEENLRRMYSRILEETNYDVFFNVDATAHDRGGYHFLYEYGGNIFLENRYTTWAKYYYPYQTLRNLWMLSKYVPAERFQIEFLNKWLNTSNYTEDDVFAPIHVPFQYLFAITMAAQPLAWFEGTGLPEEAHGVSEVIEAYSEIRQRFHEGAIFPIGNEPCGRCWTGFQSITSGEEGYLIVYRELNDTATQSIDTYLQKNAEYRFTKILGDGNMSTRRVDESRQIEVSIPHPHGFLLVHYSMKP